MANPNRPMIYIDASRYSNTGKRTGVENYSYFLINKLVEKHGNEITLISPRPIDLDVKQIIIPFPRLWTLLRLSWEIFKNRKINNIFVPSHVLPVVYPDKTCITIHDVVFKYSPESYGVFSRIYLDWATKFAVRNASSIIVPSEATKQDLIKFYKAKSSKISVVHLGHVPTEKTETDRGQTLEKYGLEKDKYFLYIGRLEYKKNTDTLLKAFQKFNHKNPGVKLVLAGFAGHGGEEIIQRMPKSLDEDVVLTGYISGEEKSTLLENALCFVFPSRFEGFGLPLLEAMDARLPIIASDIPSSREVAEDSATFFKKESSSELSELMDKMVSKKEFGERLVQNHQKNLSRFSWEKCAEEVYKALQ